MSSQDQPTAGPAPVTSEAAARLLGALLAVAEQQKRTALVETVQPPVTVVNLPELGAGVLVLDRGDVDAGTLTQRLERLVSAPSKAILHVVLVGGGPAERALVEAADRTAPNPNRLGVWHVDDQFQLSHVRGRKLLLLEDAARQLPTAKRLTAEATTAAAEAARKAQEEALAFATLLQSRRPLVTWILCGTNVLLFLLATRWGKFSSFLDAEMWMGANRRELVAEGEVWRLLSHAFLHGSATHLIMNMFALYSFGGFLERLLGWRRYVVLYTASALAGGLASAFVGNTPMSVGASGAIFGLMGAGFALVRRRAGLLPTLMARQLRGQLVPTVVINIALSFFPLIDKYAHFGGGVVGLALVATGLLTRGLDPASAQVANARREPWSLRIAAVLAVALLVAAVGIALIAGKPWQPRAFFPPDPG